MKKLLTGLFVTGLLLGGAGVALAGHEETRGPGPNGHNNHGLCTAFFNGQKNGHGRPEDGGTAPGPFQALYDEAQDEAPRNNDNDDSNDVEGIEAVINYCNQYGIDGNPEHGRYADELADYAEENPDEKNNRRGGGNK